MTMSKAINKIQSKYEQALDLPNNELCSTIQEVISDIEALPLSEWHEYSILYKDEATHLPYLNDSLS